MLAQITGYAENQTKLADIENSIDAKNKDIAETEKRILANSEKIASINEQLDNAALEMAKGVLSDDEFLKLKTDADNLSALINALNTAKQEQLNDLAALNQAKQQISGILHNLKNNYANEMLNKSINDAIDSVKEPLKLIISDMMIKHSHGYAFKDGIYHLLGVEIMNATFGNHLSLDYSNGEVSAIRNAKERIETLKQSFLAEV